MNYRPTFVPVLDSGKSAASVQGADGKILSSIVAGDVTAAQAASFVSGNNSTVARAAIGNTVQPNSAQLAGLLAYLAAIQAGTVTTTVETSISGL